MAEAGGLREGLALAEELRPDALVTDLRMEDGSGLELAAGVRRMVPGVKVVLLTGYAGGDRSCRGGTNPVDRVLEKPARPREVRKALEGLLGLEKPAGKALPGKAACPEWRGSPAALARRGERRLLWGEEEED